MKNYFKIFVVHSDYCVTLRVIDSNACVIYQEVLK